MGDFHAVSSWKELPNCKILPGGGGKINFQTVNLLLIARLIHRGTKYVGQVRKGIWWNPQCGATMQDGNLLRENQLDFSVKSFVCVCVCVGCRHPIQTAKVKNGLLLIIQSIKSEITVTFDRRCCLPWAHSLVPWQPIYTPRKLPGRADSQSGRMPVINTG